MNTLTARPTAVLREPAVIYIKQSKAIGYTRERPTSPSMSGAAKLFMDKMTRSKMVVEMNSPEEETLLGAYSDERGIRRQGMNLKREIVRPWVQKVE
jgi:hypothetical protein